MEAPVLTIVIVSFNTHDLLRRCIRGVELQSATVSSEVIVVDNDSKDGSAAMVEAEFPEVHLIRADRNLRICGRQQSRLCDRARTLPRGAEF